MKEKDTLEILALFEQELDERLEESKSEIERVKYYEKFTINEIDFENIFITAEKDVDGNITYHIYCGESSNEILAIDSEGKVEIKNKDLEKYIDEIDLESLMEENEKDSERLKGISKKATPEEAEEAIEQQDDETEKIEQDLAEQGEDLEISKFRQIKDSHIDERMPEVFGDDEEHGIAFSNKLHRYVIISKVNGQYQLNENIEPAKPTWKTIISISPDGEQVERKVPYALMKMPNNDKKEIAVTIDDYGIPKIETVDVLPCQERIARAVREEGEGLEGEEQLEIRREFETEGKEYKHDIAHNVQEIEDAQRDANQTVDYDITPDDFIPNTEMTWGELMDETGELLPKLIERYNREMQKNSRDSKEIVETIEQDYGMVNRQH